MWRNNWCKINEDVVRKDHPNVANRVYNTAFWFSQNHGNDEEITSRTKEQLETWTRDDDCSCVRFKAHKLLQEQCRSIIDQWHVSLLIKNNYNRDVEFEVNFPGIYRLEGRMKLERTFFLVMKYQLPSVFDRVARALWNVVIVKKFHYCSRSSAKLTSNVFFRS